MVSSNAFRAAVLTGVSLCIGVRVQVDIGAPSFVFMRCASAANAAASTLACVLVCNAKYTRIHTRTFSRNNLAQP